MKRIIALIVAAMMLLTGINAYAVSESGAFNENYYIEARRLLEEIDVAPKGGSGTMVDSPISRMEFLQMAVRAGLGGAEPSESSLPIPFADVSASDKKYIQYAIDEKMILSRDEDFRPNDDAELDFAEMILVGMADMDIADGAYVRKAGELGITDKLRPQSAAEFKKGDAYVMIYNYLTEVEVPYFGETGLKAYYDIESVKGFLEADSFSSADNNPCNTGYVRLRISDTQTLELAYTGDASELLGRRVKAYYNSETEAVLIVSADSRDIIAEISGSMYEDYNKSTRKLSWNEYKSGDRWEKTTKRVWKVIPQSADIIFNGNYTTDHSFVYSILANGSGYDVDKITLISTGGSGGIDLVKIDAYRAVHVSYADKNSMVIKDKNSRSVYDFDEGANQPEITVYNESGETADFSEIKVNDVVQLFETRGDSRRLKIVISRAHEDGTVSSIDNSEERCTVIADGVSYTVSRSFEAYVSGLAVGRRYTLYLDRNGFICGYSAGGTDDIIVGGVSQIRSYDDVSKVLVFEIYTPDGQFADYKTAEKWNVNDSPVYMDSDDNVVYKDEAGEVQKASVKLKTQFVQFKLDSQGNIKTVRTAKKNAVPGELGYTMGIADPDDIFANPQDNSMIFKTNGQIFIPYSGNKTMRFAVKNSATKVIKMPSSNIMFNRAAYFSNQVTISNDNQFPVVGYTLKGSDNVVADYLVIVSDSSSNPKDSDNYVVKKMSKGLNSDGLTGYELTLVNARTGEESSIMTEDLNFPGYDIDGNSLGSNVNVEKGDIIKYGTNTAGDASGYILMYDMSTGAIQEKDTTYWYGSMRIVRGCVYSVDGLYFSYVNSDTMPADVSGKLQLGYAKTAVLVDSGSIDSRYSDEFVKSGTPEDLTAYVENSTNYSRIIYMTGHGEVRMLVAYK